MSENIPRITVKFAGEVYPALEGEAPLLAGLPGDNLERANLGFWLVNWRLAGSKSRSRKSSLFIPWANVRYVEKPDGD